MTDAYFISDAHLGLGTREAEREKETRLLKFLDHAGHDGKHIYILGDLFDSWFEYRTVIPKGFHRLLAKLDDLTHNGTDVHYLAGNHDAWMRNFFHEELGVTIHHDAFAVSVGGKKIFLHHGDGLAINDTGYRILKKILRSKTNIWLYSWLHPDLGLALARTSSRKSRHYTSAKHYGEEDGMLRFAKEKIGEGFDAVIMGHRHQPAAVPIGSGMYLNLGDWITHHTYAQLSDGKLQLLSWKE